MRENIFRCAIDGGKITHEKGFKLNNDKNDFSLEADLKSMDYMVKISRSYYPFSNHILSFHIDEIYTETHPPKRRMDIDAGDEILVIKNKHNGKNIIKIRFTPKEKERMLSLLSSFLIQKEKTEDLKKYISNQIEEMYKTLSQNAETEKLINGFLKNYSRYFTEHNFMFLIEKNIYDKFHLYLKEKTPFHTLVLSEIVQSKLWHKQLWQRNIFWDAFPDEFQKLIELMCENVKSEDYSELFMCVLYLVVWQMLKEKTIKYHSKVFYKNAKDYFKNTENLTLKECLDVYCDIDIIAPQKKENISLLTYFLMQNNKFSTYTIDQKNYIECYNLVKENLDDIFSKYKLERFREKLYNSSSESNNKQLSINDIDLMTGVEFENFVSRLFENFGYSTYITKANNDQGVDIIAEKKGQKIAIQTKCYTGQVSNSAIQEIAAGLKYYDVQKGLVITNSYFTQSAIKLAESNNIVIWDRELLKEKLKDFTGQ